jgi:hypothetical protein
MPTIFIVRPFGNNRPVIKKNKDAVPEIVFFDFDKVEQDLITPAMNAAGLTGGTTQRIFESGEIKEDMFSGLLLADIVIADITIHNANVFYELGIRHALRQKTTVLIKCAGFDETPFDIIGYKYIDYEKDNPGAALNILIQFLADSPISIKKDSPVFNMLPKLEEQDTEKFLAVPADFTEEVDIAKASGQPGMLALLSSEAESFKWLLPALRIIGNAQFSVKAFEAAQMTWEKIRWHYPKDREANDRLATIYQRLAEEVMTVNPATGVQLLTKSDQAINRMLENYAGLEKSERAEVYSLSARNTKSRWVESWKNIDDTIQRQKTALQSKYLVEAFEDYERGYNADLNHFYSGINALGLLTSLVTLAERFPDEWEGDYDSTEQAAQQLRDYKSKKDKLSIMVQISVEAERKRLQIEQPGDRGSWIWMSITEADLACFISARPQRVGNLYRDAITGATGLNLDASRRQLQIYEALNVVSENVKAALEEFAKIPETFSSKLYYLLFTGHMIDKPDRENPRFPPQYEAAVKAAIKDAVQKEKDKHEGPVKGIAGGGCGGDILFHEVCGELGIQTELYLALPREKFLGESVDFAGPEWVERFDSLYRKLPTHILSPTKELPNWLQKKPDYSIWERNNLWMLNKALECGGIQMTLIALWDGKGGDGAGGTEHMVKEAKARGSKTIIIDINQFK